MMKLIRKLINKAIFSGRSDRSKSRSLLPWLNEVYTRLDNDLRCHRSAAEFQRHQHLFHVIILNLEYDYDNK